MEEILASQKQMLVRRGEPTDRVADDQMTDVFDDHLENVESFLNEKPHMDTIYVSYNDVLENPKKNIRNVNKFLENSLNETRMSDIVDKRLHRQKR